MDLFALTSLDTALSLIKKNDRIVTAMAAAEPRAFFSHLHKIVKHAENLTVHCANPNEDYPCFYESDLQGQLELEVMFLTNCIRKEQGHNRVHYIPQHLSQWSKNLIARGPIDIFWGTCSYPDEKGFVSLGLGCCYEPEILAKAQLIVLEVNKNIPWTCGATEIHISQVHQFIENTQPLPTITCENPSAEEITIAKYVCELIADESTIQLGIGAIPNAIGNELKVKKNLGIHTEMMTESMMTLMKQGVVTNAKKSLHPGKTIASFILGSKDLYDFVNQNKDIQLLPSSYVNDPAVIGLNHKMTSINTAVELDLTGQVCSESVGHRQISGVGGATDTHTGAQRSPAGRGIIALKSTSTDLSYSKIVFELKAGAKISLSRNDIDTVITEYGVAHLRGASVATRVRRLIQIAHPKFRDELNFQAQNASYI